ncbi:MAG: type VI secretion system membrane subunit TssM, partial [Pseudomonadaceae bacterium]
LDTRFDSYPLDQPLVQQSRAILRSESLASVVYRMLREQSDNLPDYRLINRLGPQATLLASSQHAIPGLYTQNGYQRLFVAQGNELLQDLLDDNWVLGDSERMSSRDLNRLMQEVERLYFADYANHWADAIALLNVDPMRDITQGATQVAGFGGASSPLLLLLQEVRDNTLFLPNEDLSTPLDQPLASNGRSEVNRALERRFEPLHRLLDDEGLAGPELTHALQALDALQVQLAALAHANHPEHSAYQLARQRMQGQEDALQQVRVSASRLPDPVKSWLTRLADDSWALVLADAHRYINQRYRSELYSNYRSALESRYPFQADSESDVALADFREFFRAEGVADRFFEQYLQLFITGSPGQYRIRQVDGRGLPVSRNFLSQMGRIQTIRRSFFAENPAEPQVQFKLEPYLLDSSLGRANFRIGNQSLEYRHGPIVQSTFRWPMEAEDGRSSLILEDLGGRRLTLDQNSGPWSLFRLLDQLEVDHHHERDALILKANLSGLRANYLLHSQRSPNPFDMVQLRGFSLPARL